MRYIIALIGLLATSVGMAQTVPGSVKVNWALPTLSVDGLPLNGATTISAAQVFVST
jgi:hypothetical protein